jgi:RNA polymerase sigma-70 factor (ECF subfamily)
MAAAEVVQHRGDEEVSDERLVAQVCDGDGTAFQILYDRYFPRVFAFVRKRLNNRADAEETVQEIFINVFSSMGSYRGESPFAAWVLGVSRRIVANRFKKRRPATVSLELGDDPYPKEVAASVRRQPTPLEIFECEERLAQLERIAQQQLTSEQQKLFELHHLRHRSIQDIALELDKSENAVKSNLYRARKLLLAP